MDFLTHIWQRNGVAKKPFSSRPSFRPVLEEMERRLVPATVVWDGGGLDNLASTPANWAGDVLPTIPDTMLFNETSAKSAVIDAAFLTQVAGL